MWEFSEQIIRVGIFVSVLLLCMLFEFIFPRRQRVQDRLSRWLTNLGVVILNSFLLKMMGPFVALSVAAYGATHHWGLLSVVDMPVVIEVVIAVVLLDLAIYAQHVASHKIEFLWRFHQVHHADRDIDTTTGVRFHPVEVVLSMLYKSVVVILLGVPVLAVLIFEVLLNASALFNHANLRLPKRVEHYLRMLMVTPDMHRVHHSVIEQETNSNYGFCLSLWDRWFATYTHQPQHGHEKMTIGLTQYQHHKPASLLWCLRLPFLR